HSINIENQNEIRECISEIEKVRDNAEEIKREYFEVDTIVDIMFSILKKYSLNLLSYQEKLSENLEYFEDRLHHAILLNIEKISNLISQEKYPTCATQLDAILKLSHPNSDNYSRSSYYIEFINFFKNHLENEKMFSNREELLSICKNLEQIFKNEKTEDIPVINRADKSLNVILDFIETFSKTGNSLKEFHQSLNVFYHIVMSY
ncbi:unnamed protein product, partial [Didymodactylos carnosus]